MGLKDLPEELLILILKQLDLKSIQCLYDAGIPHVQNVIASGCIKNCDISLSTMATINTLRTNFFETISTHLTTLDLKGVKDLSKKTLPTMTTMENLTNLNVAYTDITIFDFLRIYDQCPSIKNICIDFQFPRKWYTHFSQELLLKCQKVFASMETVHFVGSKQNLLQSHLPELILQKAKLSSLTYTVVKNDEMITFYRYADCEPIIFDNLNIFSPRWRECVEISTPYRPKIFKNIRYYDYEFISVCEMDFKTVECTPVFKKFLEESFGQKAKVKYQLSDYYDPDYMKACLLWNKETTTFDERFFKNLLPKIAPLFPCKLQADDNMEEGYSDSDEEDTLLTSDWIWVRFYEPDPYDYPPQKKPLSINYRKLDYDILLRNKQNVELNIFFSHNAYNNIPVTLSPHSNFIEKLSFLSLMAGAHYSSEFFTVLFCFAKNLITLNVQFEPYLIDQIENTQSSLSQISKQVHLSKSLKNLRIVVRNFFDNTFSLEELCQCKTLENVILSDTSFKKVKDIGKPEILIQHCENLYYLCIEVVLTKTYRTKKHKLLNEAKNCYGRPHLYIEFKSKYSCKPRYKYDPFIEVFKLAKIKSIDM